MNDAPTFVENDECRLLRRLRERPELLHEIEESTDSELSLQHRLRSRYDDALVRAALRLRDSRRKAAAKFTRAKQMWLDRVGLEQATSEEVARHKSTRFSGRVWDLCSGIGGDAVALADRCEVVAVDRNPAQCLRASWNAEVYATAERLSTHCADVETIVVAADLIHIDPDRRQAPGKPNRSLRLEDLSPGVEFLETLRSKSRGGAIKLSPASNFPGKFEGAEIELVSVRGECKEATIWFGELAPKPLWRATSLPSGETVAGDPLEWLAERRALGKYLYDPDPAVVRAGLIDFVGCQQGLARLDAAEEYLTGDELVSCELVTPFEVVAELPNNERSIRNYFRSSDIGDVEIKRRRIPIDPNVFRRRLPLDGSSSAVLIFARVEERAKAIVRRRVRTSASGGERGVY